MKPSRIHLVILALFLGATRAWTQAPEYINYQGTLNDASGNPLPTSIYTMAFRIYDRSSGGTVLWGPFTFPASGVPVVNGKFNVILGPEDSMSRPLSAAFANSDTRFIGIAVGGTSPSLEIRPRQQFLSAPYAFNAAKVQMPIAGTDNNGTTAALMVSNGNQLMLIDGNEIDAAAGPLYLNHNSEEDVYIVRNGGNVGIGTDAPDVRLHVAGGSDVSLSGGGFLIVGDAGGPNIAIDNNEIMARDNGQTLPLVFQQSGGNVRIGSSNDSDGKVQVTSGTDVSLADGGYIVTGRTNGLSIGIDNNEIMARDNGGTSPLYLQRGGGFVGVGSFSGAPNALLHVGGQQVTVTSSDGGRGIKHGFGLVQAWTPSEDLANLVAYFDGSILATDALVSLENPIFSDARAKAVLGRSSGEEDLQTLDRIQITDYRWIDQSKGNDRVQKKVIAQEVEELLPNAVSRLSKAIPNVYQPATQVSYDAKEHRLTMSVGKAHDFQPGDLVDVYTDRGNLIKAEVLEVASTNSFTIASESEAKEAFVYGKWVNDYRVVDYDAIAMLNVSATQELHRKLRAQEAEISALKQTLTRIQSGEQTREARTAALEKLVSRLAQAAGLETNDETATLGNVTSRQVALRSE